MSCWRLGLTRTGRAWPSLRCRPTLHRIAGRGVVSGAYCVRHLDHRDCDDFGRDALAAGARVSAIPAVFHGTDSGDHI